MIDDLLGGLLEGAAELVGGAAEAVGEAVGGAVEVVGEALSGGAGEVVSEVLDGVADGGLEVGGGEQREAEKQAKEIVSHKQM